VRVVVVMVMLVMLVVVGREGVVVVAGVVQLAPCANQAWRTG
jgi:hypothetical protein